MNENLTELVFILDRSGSMCGMEEDTIGGFNSMLDKQKKEPGDALVTTVLFDNEYETMHDRAPLQCVRAMTANDYSARGSTALLDAVGRAISLIRIAQKHTPEAERPGKTVVVIITDGYENSSREYSIEQVREMISKQTGLGWEFLFLGANMDAVQAAGRMNIRADRAATYRPDGAGTRANYDAVDMAIRYSRAGRHFSDEWRAPVDERNNRDY